MDTNSEHPRLHVRPHMSLERSMAEVRRYLKAATPAPAKSAATDNTLGSEASEQTPNPADSASNNPDR